MVSTVHTVVWAPKMDTYMEKIAGTKIANWRLMKKKKKKNLKLETKVTEDTTRIPHKHTLAQVHWYWKLKIFILTETN